MRIVLTGGGTGGHLVPLAPFIEALRILYLNRRTTLPRNTDPDRLELFFCGPVDAKTRAFFAHYDIPVLAIPAGKVRRYASLKTAVDLLIRLPAGIVIALIRLWWLMPEVVISKGGYGSVPTVCAAWFYRIPILLHESDAVPGLANSAIARFSAAIAVSYEVTKKRWSHYGEKVLVTGTPVRSSFAAITPAEAKQFFDLPASERVLVILGGSQGSAQLNEVLLKALPSLILDMAIIHLTGSAHFSAVKTVGEELLANSSRRSFYKVYPYLTDAIAHAFVAADVVVSRAGATTLAELASLGKPILLIPLPSAANDHQRHNAALFESHGAARVLDPTNVNQALFEQNIRLLMDDTVLRAQLGANIKKMYFPQAAETLAALTFKLAAGLAPTA